MRKSLRQLAATAPVSIALAAGAACAPPAGFVHGGRVPESWALPVEVVTLEPYDAVVLPMRGSYAAHDAAIARVADVLGRAGIRPVGTPFGRYFNDPSQVAEPDQLWEVGFPIGRVWTPPPPFEARQFPRQLAAHSVVVGPYAEGARRWPALHSWITANGYASVGAAMAIWSGNPALGGALGPKTELRMPVVRLSVPLLLAHDLVCLFGAAVFALFSLLYVRERRARAALWGGAAWGLLGVCCACLYLPPLLRELMYLYMGSGPWLGAFESWSDAIGFVAPPLLVHLFYYRGRSHLPHRRLWLALVGLVYALDGGFMLLVFRWPHLVERLAKADTVGGALVAAAALVALAIERTAQRTNERSVAEHHSYGALLVVIAIAALVTVATRGQTVEAVAHLVLLAAPIALLFLTAYHNERAAFFDVLVKAGSFLLLALLLLGLYFSVVPHLLFSVRQGWLGLWLFPASALPLVLAAPWGYRRLSALVDRLWLGRRLSPAQAGQELFGALRGAPSEAELVSRAEAGLALIFQAPARILLGPVLPAEQAGAFGAPVRANGALVGTIRIDARAGRRQLLSEDRALLESLAQGFSLVLDNVRLHERHLAQETKERELLLHASRSELRALRAQINPHFLFNALNTIAALIPRDPPRAEATVERLAEVFRYTLRGSELEWARVCEEMTFVRAYLELELTRFGERLRVASEVEPAAERALVPAMVVQTLVENAVKHGVGACRGQGRVEVAIRCRDGRLRIEVRDSGPGFTLPALDPPPATPGAGRGLRNIRERLRGYFGDAASLSVDRDAERAMTSVCVTLPLLSEAPSEEGRP